MNTIIKMMIGLAVCSMAFSPANAKINNGNDFLNKQNVELYYDPLGDGVRGTTWSANPLRIQSPNNQSLKPEVMWIHLHSEGYYGLFNQYVEINCKEPVKSHIMTADGEKISLKKSMSYPDTPESTYDTTYPDRIDRAVVESIFSYYCS